MAKIAKLPWPIRLLTLLAAAGVSLYVLELYDFGGRFVTLIANLSPPPPKRQTPQFQTKEPGVVPVTIVAPRKAADPAK
jgi:hypothetical protein